MVNNIQESPKHKILRLLRDSGTPISGEKLGDELGISRVAIHKHIKGLRDEGYLLDVTHSGYQLARDASAPFSSWEFDAGEGILVLEKTGSTMDEAHRQAMRKPGEDFILAARTQTGGRGRRERSWASPEGGLWVTRVIHPAASVSHLARYTLAAAAALAKLLRSDYGIAAEVKWPNDVIVNHRKVAGILTEGRFSGDQIQYMAIGMGLNVNNQTSPEATALKEISGREEDRRQLLRGWISAGDGIFTDPEFLQGKGKSWWSDFLYGIGSKVAYSMSHPTVDAGEASTKQVEPAGKQIRGYIREVDALGRLVLEKENGRKVRLTAGDIEEKI